MNIYNKSIMKLLDVNYNFDTIKIRELPILDIQKIHKIQNDSFPYSSNA